MTSSYPPKPQALSKEISHFVLCREVILFSEAKNVLMLWERGPKERPVILFLEGPLS